MHKIENDLVTFEIAKSLSEIGFEESCLIYINSERDLVLATVKSNYSSSEFRMPYWSQVIDWFRNEKKLEINVFKWGVHCYHKEDNTNGECEIIALPHYIYDIEKAFEYTDDWEYQSLDDELKFHSYEEARVSAILKAIEIVKNLK